MAFASDNADDRTMDGVVSSVVAEFGGVDILVNNAGIFEVGSLEKTLLEDIQRNLHVNVIGVVLATRAVIPHLGPGSRIINIGSCLATRVPGLGIALYALTKAALIGLTKGLARDLGGNGTTVNIVHPGPTDTDMNPAARDGAEGQRQRIALGHFGSPDDIAATASLFLQAKTRDTAQALKSRSTAASTSNSGRSFQSEEVGLGLSRTALKRNIMPRALARRSVRGESRVEMPHAMRKSLRQYERLRLGLSVLLDCKLRADQSCRGIKYRCFIQTVLPRSDFVVDGLRAISLAGMNVLGNN